MKKIFVTAAVVFWGCGLAGSALAAGMGSQEAGSAAATGQMQAGLGEISPASRLLGKSVQDLQGNRLGEVDEIMIDAERGHIAYLVVDPAEEAGAGSEKRLVPYAALHLDPETQTLTAKIEADEFKDAPLATEIADREQAEEIHRFYGVAPYWEERDEVPAEQAPAQQGKDGELIPSPTPHWWE